MEIANIKNKEIISVNDKSVIFMDTTQTIQYSIPCNDNTLFIDLIKKLYEEYPQCVDTSCSFLFNGAMITNHFKTVKEIGCGNRIILVLIMISNDYWINNKKLVKI